MRDLALFTIAAVVCVAFAPLVWVLLDALNRPSGGRR